MRNNYSNIPTGLECSDQSRSQQIGSFEVCPHQAAGVEEDGGEALGDNLARRGRDGRVTSYLVRSHFESLLDGHVEPEEIIE